jgi:hypothetical protein
MADSMPSVSEGAAGGAAAGSILGPIGTIAGGLIGAAVSWWGINEQSNSEAENRALQERLFEENRADENLWKSRSLAEQGREFDVQSAFGEKQLQLSNKTLNAQTNLANKQLTAQTQATEGQLQLGQQQLASQERVANRQADVQEKGVNYQIQSSKENTARLLAQKNLEDNLSWFGNMTKFFNTPETRAQYATLWKK